MVDLRRFILSALKIRQKFVQSYKISGAISSFHSILDHTEISEIST